MRTVKLFYGGNLYHINDTADQIIILIDSLFGNFFQKRIIYVIQITINLNDFF